MSRSTQALAILVFIFVIAFCACSGSSYGSSYSYKHTYRPTYSYPTNYGFGCVHSRKTTSTTINHPIYGKIKTKSTKLKTTC